MPANTYPYYLAGVATAPNLDIEVFDKFTGGTASHVASADPAAFSKALHAAETALTVLAARPRADRLVTAARLGVMTESRAREFSEILAIETGRPKRACREDVFRFVEALKAPDHEQAPWVRALSGAQRSFAPDAGRPWLVILGDCTSFTALGQLLSHALLSGTSLIVCPSRTSPLAPLLLGSLLAELSLPRGAFSILTMEPILAELDAERFGLIAVPELPALAGLPTDRSFALNDARPLIIVGGPETRADDVMPAIRTHVFRGRSHVVGPCLVNPRTLPELRAKAVDYAASLKPGSPLERTTTLSPLPSIDVAHQVDAWLAHALEVGAKIHAGGWRQGVMMQPTVVEVLDERVQLAAPPAGAPILVLQAAPSFTMALRKATEIGNEVRVLVVSADRGRIRHAWETSGVAEVLTADTSGGFIRAEQPERDAASSMAPSKSVSR